MTTLQNALSHPLLNQKKWKILVLTLATFAALC